jgi:uncharacterized protein (TIGR02246 family)
MYASNMKLAGVVVMLNILVASGKEEVVSNQNREAISTRKAASAASDPIQQGEVEQLLRKYERALNAGDVQNIMRIYSIDPVVMAQQNPSAVGASAVEGFYTGTFKAVAFTLKFQVAEVKFLGAEWAMLRSTSVGTMKILANGAMVPSANQELFVLHKESGKWKFARYSLSSTLPAVQ